MHRVDAIENSPGVRRELAEGIESLLGWRKGEKDRDSLKDYRGYFKRLSHPRPAGKPPIAPDTFGELRTSSHCIVRTPD
ncbi:hypothetical protein GW17_00039605 [Ensete ventricosum]|nr:hypothetical protein GW17_00039605 [Ensete ventricosum]